MRNYFPTYIGKEEYNPTEKKVLKRVMYIPTTKDNMKNTISSIESSELSVKFKSYARNATLNLQYENAKEDRRLGFMDIIKYYDFDSDPHSVKNLFLKWILFNSNKIEQSYLRKIAEPSEKFKADFDIKMAHFPKQVKQKLKSVIQTLVDKFRYLKLMEQARIEREKLPKWKTVADYVKYQGIEGNELTIPQVIVKKKMAF